MGGAVAAPLGPQADLRRGRRIWRQRNRRRVQLHLERIADKILYVRGVLVLRSHNERVGHSIRPGEFDSPPPMSKRRRVPFLPERGSAETDPPGATG